LILQTVPILSMRLDIYKPRFFLFFLLDFSNQYSIDHL